MSMLENAFLLCALLAALTILFGVGELLVRVLTWIRNQPKL